MKQSLDNRQQITALSNNLGDDQIHSIIALPLQTNNEILGVIELDRLNHSGFNVQEIEFAKALAIQSSLSIYLQKQISINLSNKNIIDLLDTIGQISKSITSNVDLENLINSILSLIHQNSKYTRISLYIKKKDEIRVLSCKSISNNGIDPPMDYHFDNEDNPIGWCISHLTPVVINDINHENRFLSTNFTPDIKSELVIPLICGDEFLGVLDIRNNVIDAFNPELIRIYQLLVDNIAVAIRNAKLFRNLELHGQIVEKIQEVINFNLPISEILESLLAELGNFIPYDASAIWLYDDMSSDSGLGQFTSSLKIAAVRIDERFSTLNKHKETIGAAEIKSILSQNEGDLTSQLAIFPWLSDIIDSGRPIIRNFDSPNEPFGLLLSFPDGYSALGVQLLIDDKPNGVLILAHHLPDQYSNDSKIIAEIFCKYAAIGIENTKLFSIAHDHVWMYTILQQIAEATQSITSIHELLETIASMITDLVGVNACTIYLWDQAINTFFPQVSYGYDQDQQERLVSWNIDSGSISKFDEIIELLKPTIINSDNLSEEIAELVFPSQNLQTNLFILFPIVAQENLIGASLIDFSNTAMEKDFSQKLWDDKYQLLQAITNQTAGTIEYLQRLRSREEEAYISVALLQVAQAIVSMNKLEEILGAIVRITPILVGVKRCIIYLWNSLEKVFQPAQNYGFSKLDLQIIGQIFRANEFPLLQTIMVKNQIAYHQLLAASSPTSWKEIESSYLHLLLDASGDSDEQYSIKLDDDVLRDKSRLLIGFPLSVKNEVLGVMLIEEEDPGKAATAYHIREKRIEIVKGITQQAALAIKNEQLQRDVVRSERMEKELQLAREIQTTFLPEHLPTLSGWDIDIRWQPARQVGGDFYDILHLDENHIGLVIADVADKGMPAALFMTLIRTLIRAAAKDHTSPASVLKQVNELLIPDTKHGMFVTVFYAVIDLITGLIIYTNAGHNPPIIKKYPAGELIELTRTSIALGIFDDIQVDEAKVIMQPGDLILFYTDGVTEAFSIDEEMFGTKRLYDLISNKRYISSKELLDSIECSINQFLIGVDLSDDLTLAALYRKAT